MIINDYKILEEILNSSSIGVLGLFNGTSPYTVPVNFVYHEKHIYFHSAESGTKIDILKQNPIVSFLVFIDRGILPNKIPCKIGQSFKSIMITGEAAIVGDIKEKKDALEALIKKYVPEGGYIGLTEETVVNYKSRLNRKTAVIKIKINEISGKEKP
jgi:nitroimidazol reductase NimA-like FMN-containing flavoprotein (pyridoxamine 5'-phosphate oxidase superfamily)